MEHAGGGKHNHGAGLVDVGAVKRLGGGGGRRKGGKLEQNVLLSQKALSL